MNMWLNGMVEIKDWALARHSGWGTENRLVVGNRKEIIFRMS